jgi:nicotinamide riboside transporter PnuC
MCTYRAYKRVHETARRYHFVLFVDLLKKKSKTHFQNLPSNSSILFEIFVGIFHKASRFIEFFALLIILDFIDVILLLRMQKFLLEILHHCFTPSYY